MLTVDNKLNNEWDKKKTMFPLLIVSGVTRTFKKNDERDRTVQGVVVRALGVYGQSTHVIRFVPPAAATALSG